MIGNTNAQYNNTETIYGINKNLGGGMWLFQGYVDSGTISATNRYSIATVTLPNNMTVANPNACFPVVSRLNGSDSGWASVDVRVVNRRSTGFDVEFWNHGSDTGFWTVSWMLLAYCGP